MGPGIDEIRAAIHAMDAANVPIHERIVETYKPPSEISFTLDDKTGRLFINDEGKIAFDGDLDVSAQALFDYLVEFAPSLAAKVLAGR